MREAKIDAAAIRHFVFNTHYRKELNLSEDALEASMSAVRRVGDFAERLSRATAGTPELTQAAAEAQASVEDALFDDLSAPNALAALFTFITKGNAELDRLEAGATGAAGPLEAAQASFRKMNGVLDILPGPTAVDPELAAWAEQKIAERAQARARRDFKRADEIRAELTARDVLIEDSARGTTWKLAR